MPQLGAQLQEQGLECAVLAASKEGMARALTVEVQALDDSCGRQLLWRRKQADQQRRLDKLLIHALGDAKPAAWRGAG